MIEDILAGLIRANLALGLALVMVILLRAPARRAFGARAAYGLWLAPPMAALAALIPPASAASPLVAEVVLEATAAAGAAVEASVLALPGPPILLFGLWVAGMAGAAALLRQRQARFMVALGALEPLGAGLFRAARSGAGPAVVGALRPRIVTPADFETRFAPAEREVILAHERAHLAAGDARINALAAAALCACWFNPLVHLGVWLMRIDQELACDAAVLGRFPRARKLYAKVLLETQLAAQPLPFGCQWPATSDHPLKARILMLKAPLPTPSRRIAGTVAVVALSLLGACGAWAAARPGTPDASGPTVTLAEGGACSPEAVRLYNCRESAPPVWLRQPTPQEVRNEYPANALADGIAARVTLSCLIDGADGSLKECLSIRVERPGQIPAPPARYDFERAALRLARYYRRDVASLPRDDQGRLPQVRMTIAFSPPKAAQAAPAPGVIPDWARRPDGADVAWAYPAAAKAANLEGRATLSCRVAEQGRLDACEVASEAPQDAGFGQAALLLAARFQMNATDRNGRPTRGAAVRIPILFRLPPSEATAATAAPRRSADPAATAGPAAGGGSAG